MTGDVDQIGVDDAIQTASRIMYEDQIRRLVIVSLGDQRLLMEVVSFGDLSTKGLSVR